MKGRNCIALLVCVVCSQQVAPAAFRKRELIKLSQSSRNYKLLQTQV